MSGSAQERQAVSEGDKHKASGRSPLCDRRDRTPASDNRHDGDCTVLYTDSPSRSLVTSVVLCFATRRVATMSPSPPGGCGMDQQLTPQFGMNAGVAAMPDSSAKNPGPGIEINLTHQPERSRLNAVAPRSISVMLETLRVFQDPMG